MVTSRTEHDRLSSAAFWVKGMVEAFKQEGLDVVALFREAGLDLAALDNPDSRFPIERLSLLWRLAVTRSGNPTVGLAAARIPKPALFGVVGYAMMSSPDLRGLLERVARYFRIISDATTVSVAADQEGYRLRFGLLGGGTEMPWQRRAFGLLSVLSFVRWIMMCDLRPLAVELTTTAHDEAQPYQEAFECPLRFGAAVNALLFSHSDAGRPLPTAQPHLARVHERIAGEYLARLDHSRTNARVRAAILERIAHGEPRRAAVARVLGMSERTVQRRLEEDGTSFRQILDDTRKELAQKYFEHGSVSLADTAYLLGFNDQSSFFRATKRWFGTTPQQYRLRHRA